MKQANLGLDLTTKRTRKRDFLDEMNRVVPWTQLVGLVTPHAPEGKRGRPPFAVETMLRIHLLQQWFTLSDPAMEEALHSHLAAGGERFRGVRPTIVWHESKEVLPADTVPNVLSRPEAMAAVKLISKFGLSLDLWAFFTQLDEVAQVCRDNPDLTVVVNHAGGPLGIGPYANRREEVFVEWRKKLEIVSRCENAVIKLGGLAMRYGGFAFNELPEPPSSDVLVEHWKRYFDVCIELFGPQRCMFESNFPVDRGMCSYHVLWNAFKKITREFSLSERQSLFSGTAARVYRLAD